MQVVATQLRRLLVEHRLGGLAASATVDGEAVLMRAGEPDRSRQIAVQALEPTYLGERVVIPMRWVATDVTGHEFPALDGNLELRALEDGSTELALIGSYRPPLGPEGEELDELMMRRVSRGTLDSFVRRLAIAVTEPPTDG